MLHSKAVIQHRDKNWSRQKMNDHLSLAAALNNNEPQLLVRSVWDSWQGEAPYMGHPATFIRLGGCNRGAKITTGCAGCDTDFSTEKSKMMPISALAKQLSWHFGQIPNRQPLVVITGGEPLLQGRGILTLIRETLTETFDQLDAEKDRRYPIEKLHFQLETNGDLLRSFAADLAKFDDPPLPMKGRYSYTLTIVCSPKLPSGVVAMPERYLDTVTCMLPGRTLLQACIRFVVSAEPTSPYHTVPELLLKWATEKKNHRSSASDSYPLYLSPMTVYKAVNDGAVAKLDNIDREATADNIRRTLELARQHSLPYSLQTHVHMGIA